MSDETIDLLVRLMAEVFSSESLGTAVLRQMKDDDFAALCNHVGGEMDYRDWSDGFE